MTVPFEVPAIRLTLSAPRAVVFATFVQGVAAVPQLITSLSPVAVPVVSGLNVILPWTVALEHVATVMPLATSLTDSSAVMWRIVPTGHLLLQGLLVVEQRTPSFAEAVPAPTKAIRAAAATAATPSIFTYFMLFLLWSGALYGRRFFALRRGLPRLSAGQDGATKGRLFPSQNAGRHPVPN